MILKMMLLIAGAGTETVHVTVATWHHPGYKIPPWFCAGNHLAFLFPSHRSLKVYSSCPRLPSMEDKRGTKRECSPSDEVSPSHSDTKTPLLVPSGSPPPSGSPSEISSCRPFSPVFEQGGPSGNILVIDIALSSDEEDFFANTSWDEDFARLLFGNLNSNILEPPNDSKMIMPHLLLLWSLRLQLPLPPTLMKTQRKCKMIIVTIFLPVRTRARAVVAETKPAHLRLPRQEWRLW
jgi:hypothetical protein